MKQKWLRGTGLLACLVILSGAAFLGARLFSRPSPHGAE